MAIVKAPVFWLNLISSHCVSRTLIPNIAKYKRACYVKMYSKAPSCIASNQWPDQDFKDRNGEILWRVSNIKKIRAFEKKKEKLVWDPFCTMAHKNIK